MSEKNENKDIFSAVQEMMEAKKQDGTLKKVSDVENVDDAIAELNPITDADVVEYEYDRDAVENSIEVDAPKKKAEEIDVSLLKISKKNALESSKMLKEALYGKTSSVEITAAQSGYTCKVSPLNNKDSFNILNSEATNFDNTKTTYKTIYDKITEFSCGPMTFKEWLQNTSVSDIETFYYGLYCATFIDEGSFKFTCPNPKCGHITEQKISNKSLRRVINFDEMTELANKISKESNSKEKMNELSLLGKAKHVQLSKSKYVFELKLPSLFDLLELYRVIDEKILKKHKDSEINSLLCTSGVLIPDKNGIYNPFDDKLEILEVIDNLPISDASELREAILDILEKHHVSYAIKSVKCAKCGKEITDIPLDIRSILFTLIYENRS